MRKSLKVSERIKEDINVAVSGSMGDHPPTLVSVSLEGSESRLALSWDDWKELVPLVMKLAQEWVAANKKEDKP